MTHFTGESEQFGVAWTPDQIAAVCLQKPYQDRRYWKTYKNTIVGIGTEASEVFSWRGLLVRSTADYDIYKPQLLYSAGNFMPLRNAHYLDVVCYEPLTDKIYVDWLEYVRAFDDALKSPRPNALLAPKKKSVLPVDGVPWEIHGISDAEPRRIAIEAYLDERV